MDIISLLQYDFVHRAFLVGVFVSIISGTLGLFLVLRKMSLLGDGLAHVSFGAVTLGLFVGIYPYTISIPLTILGALLMVYLNHKARVYADAAIGVVSAASIAAGVILASKSKGFNTDVMSYLFGNILTVRIDEVIVVAVLALGVVTVVIHYYRVLFATTFDEEYARTLGIHTQAVNAVLVTCTALTIALCIKVIGAFLISSVLIIPAVTALQLGASFKRTLICSVCFALISMIGGIMLSLLTNTPTGATIVLVHVATLGAVLTVMRVR